MKALITGGAGFIGSHLAEYLLAMGQQVMVIDDLSTGRIDNLAHIHNHPHLTIVTDDIRNLSALEPLVRECDVIYHLAAVLGVQKILREPIRTIEVNIGGTEVVLKMAHRHHKKVLVASTSEVYGKGTKFPFSEDDDTLVGATSKMRWAYAATKAVDEFLALAYHQETGLPVIVFRPFNTVGARQTGQYGMVLPRFVKWALAGEPLQVYGDGSQTRCFGNVRDVVDALYKLAQEPSAVGQVFNIGSTEEISIKGLAERVITRTKSASVIQYIPYDQAYEKGFEDFVRRVPNIAKIMGTIEWKPTTLLDETIDQIIEYMQKER
ncbi:MAG: nucleoside-diphosphate sugar epimerase [Phototrophicales bacterium]|nr:MAG: nucleoside-diphosphate sugar epimerase [Phototrophicales bacterium]